MAMVSVSTALSAFLGTAPKRLLIGGRWQDALSGETFEATNPATGELLARVAKGSSSEVDLAVAAARKAFEGEWGRVKPFDRQQILLRLADLVEQNFDDLAMLDTLDMGAPYSKTRLNRRRILSLLRYYAGMATQVCGETIENSMPGNFLTYTMREPIGVVGAIIPWNLPLTMAVWKIGPALAAGCTVILKPAEQASLTALRLAELAVEAGVPNGVLNVVTGYGDVGAALVDHRGVDKIAFTGSTDTGQHIIRASAGNIKRLSLELGGKSPNIVLADADLDKAVPGAAMAVFANAGQICTAGSRLFVERKIYPEFVARVAEFALKLRVGNGLDLDVDMGPVVSREQFERVNRYVAWGSEDGASILAGGAPLTGGGLEAGNFIAPTVFSDVEDHMRVACDEIFGPVICAIPFDDLDEVVRRANETPYGLTSGVWTANLSKAHRLAKAMRAGTVWLNCYNAADPGVPFGGTKMSGYGRESGREHINEYLSTKAVWVNLD